MAADPTGVDMARVASTMRAIDDLSRRPPCAGCDRPRSAPSRGRRRRRPGCSRSRRRQAPWRWRCCSGSNIYRGGADFRERGRRRRSAPRLGAHSANLFLQPFCAALLAGVIGALAVAIRTEFVAAPGRGLSLHDPGAGARMCSTARLDLIKGRIHLGAARLIYAGLVIVAISTGLLLGLALLGVGLPVDQAGRAVPLWQDVIAAGVAVAAYSVFFSTPLRMLPWPVAVGMLAHALRWAAIDRAWRRRRDRRLVACLAVGLILTPVARRLAHAVRGRSASRPWCR
jgi:hypothetical protein